jgi:SHS2 domain-containing protein
MAPPEPEREASRGRGHRLAPHTADCILEAWGEDRTSCLAEAMTALVEVFAEVHGDDAATRTLPLAAEPGPDADVLVALLEEVIYVADVFGAVPVRFHVIEAEDGGIAGDMVVVTGRQVELVGPVPKGVSYHDLEVGEHEGRWTCRAVVDV